MDPRALIGTWRFTRGIRDRNSGTDYAATGEAVFLPLPDGRIRWSEHGVLEWATGRTPVERTLYLVTEPGGESWTVTFDDGRAFHPWETGTVTHLCERDLYRGTITDPGLTSGGWAITWEATGPEKDYTMTSSYVQTAPGRIV